MKQWKVEVNNIDKEKPMIEWIIAAPDEDTAASIGVTKAREDPNASDSNLWVEQLALDTEGHEDKDEICRRLTDALIMTREYMDLEELAYDPATQHVTARFQGGSTKKIDVALDSGSAMIRDILRGLK